MTRQHFRPGSCQRKPASDLEPPAGLPNPEGWQTGHTIPAMRGRRRRTRKTSARAVHCRTGAGLLRASAVMLAHEWHAPKVRRERSHVRPRLIGKVQPVCLALRGLGRGRGTGDLRLRKHKTNKNAKLAHLTRATPQEDLVQHVSNTNCTDACYQVLANKCQNMWEPCSPDTRSKA